MLVDDAVQRKDGVYRPIACMVYKHETVWGASTCFHAVYMMTKIHLTPISMGQFKLFLAGWNCG